jgi:hypothetical protein
MTATASVKSIKLLAITNSDSFLKWTSFTLQKIVDECTAEGYKVIADLVTVISPLAPSENQVRAATAGTTLPHPRKLKVSQIRQLAISFEPDIILMGCTGPVGEMLAIAFSRDIPEAKRPAYISGMPGIAFHVERLGVLRRKWLDGVIVHSPAELVSNRIAYAEVGVGPDFILSTLPFLNEYTEKHQIGLLEAPITAVVFTTQAIIPSQRVDRIKILYKLAILAQAGYRVVIKLRSLATETQTHAEKDPYDTLWQEVHAHLGFAEDALEFRTGSMRDWFHPGNAFVTISSTAGLESLSYRLPTVFLNDWGTHHRLHNTVYEGSGCLHGLDELKKIFQSQGPIPDQNWMTQNYFHCAPPQLGSAVIALAKRRDAGELTRLGRVTPADYVTWFETIAEVQYPALAAAMRRGAKIARSIIPPSLGKFFGTMLRRLH